MSTISYMRKNSINRQIGRRLMWIQWEIMKLSMQIKLDISI